MQGNSQVVSLFLATCPMVKIQREFFLYTSGLIVMDDLPRWKNTKKRSHGNGWPTQVKKERVSLWWVTYPSKKRKENEGSKAHSKGWSRAWRRTRMR
jgi:hypothetical protein